MSVTGMLKAVQCLADNLIRLIGPIFVLLALSLTFSVVYVWAMVLLPLHAETIYSFWGGIHTLIAIFLVVNIVFNYVMCIRTEPGSPQMVSCWVLNTGRVCHRALGRFSLLWAVWESKEECGHAIG